MFQSNSYQLYEMAHAALAPARAVSDAAHFGLMTVEGEKDDISGVGQTYAAQELCVNIPESRKLHHLQRQVGHYGVFNGSRFRNEIAPRIRAFIAVNDEKRAISNGGGKSAAKRSTVEAREQRNATLAPRPFLSQYPLYSAANRTKRPGATAGRLNRIREELRSV